MTSTRTPEELRQDLTGGLAHAIAAKGYAATTIADIVTHARVSKRTFYEHFADKEACLMALYEQGCLHLLEVVRTAAGPGGRPWKEMINSGVSAYLTALESMPAVSRTLLVEIQAAGPKAFRLRQQMQRRFADTLVDVIERARATDPAIPALSPLLAIALVGGVHEMMLQVCDPYTGAGPSFTELAPAVDELAYAILTNPWMTADGMIGRKAGLHD
ncbi:TetR/AcrR family transcriptional regulator [Dactylosporangium matsuzakiense]|uniref:TetR family transcriptional regulator n=1 Tax=Dactylosporangium matsuzakiense TaxID=53360 RepID=A0A9W6KK78_9ACTN|nr:TetR/AcrR family transcriptional regulator [Dactylosporangium matsuzakiense]UWZ43216.1 TetR/AcrR family transcriptional regulator [Dactylosporangium matsuzakiense]GLL02688.1 TetR family transcriptional regulator [Dactylosporangium matsuzakiense]